MVELGNPIPDATLDAVTTDGVTKINPSDVQGDWLVVFTFPDIMSPVCPTEIQAFQKHLGEFEGAGARVLGVSADATKTIETWTNDNTEDGLGFPLASDPDGDWFGQLGVRNPEDGTAYRSTTIVDPEGNVVYFDTHINPMARSVSNVVRNLLGFQAFVEDGELCPADWTPGDAFIET